jgi:hypothetical protein
MGAAEAATSIRFCCGTLKRLVHWLSNDYLSDVSLRFRETPFIKYLKRQNPITFICCCITEYLINFYRCAHTCGYKGNMSLWVLMCAPVKEQKSLAMVEGISYWYWFRFHPNLVNLNFRKIKPLVCCCSCVKAYFMLFPQYFKPNLDWQDENINSRRRNGVDFVECEIYAMKMPL